MMTLSLKLLKKLCAYLAQNEDSQYSMTELVYCLKEMSTTDDTYSETHLKRRLLHKYGDSITINQLSGKCSVVMFYAAGQKILTDNWYKNRRT